MKRFILQSLILLNVLGVWAQIYSNKWMVIKPDTANGQENQLIHAIYDVTGKTDRNIYARDGQQFVHRPRQQVSVFYKNVFKDYEEHLSKTYSLYALKAGQFTSGQLDFCPTENELFMRLIWNGETAQYEVYHIDINRYGLTCDTYFYGTLEQARATPMEQWSKLSKTQDMFFFKGDSTGFYNGNALFVEDTSVPAKDLPAIRQSLEQKKSMLDSLFAPKEDMGTARKDKDTVFDIVEENPQFPGGEEACMSWLAENIKYPSICVEQWIQGRVYAQFVVGYDGYITDIQVVRSPDPYLSEEAVRVLSRMPQWKPGRQRGKAVRVKFSLPILFRLQFPKATKGKP